MHTGQARPFNDVEDTTGQRTGGLGRYPGIQQAIAEAIEKPLGLSATPFSDKLGRQAIIASGGRVIVLALGDFATGLFDVT